jgi:pimeloyl-ACP methyl ester carboxylesterase
MNVRKLALYAAGAVGLSAYAPAAATSKPQLQLRACSIPGVKQARCGVYYVPEDRRKPNGRILPLKIVVLPAKSKPPAREPVFYFEGGPGQPATKSAAAVEKLWIRDNNDVVLVDARGTGDGHRLDCILPGSDADLQGYLEPIIADAKKCGAYLSGQVDLTQYVTPVAVRDVDDVRRALGYSKINLYGASYGSRAAIVYAKMFEKNVRSAYLSAVNPLDLRMPLYFSWSGQRALDALIDACLAEEKCKQTYPDPRGDLQTAIKRLRREPALVRVTNPATGAAENLKLTEMVFVGSIRSKLYWGGDPSLLAATLRRASEGDFSKLTEDYIRAVREVRRDISLATNFAVVCSEDVTRITPEEAEKEAKGSFLGTFQVMAHLELCQSWPRAKYPSNFFAPFKSTIPTLLASGDYDPVTPPRWGEVARRYFPNSLHIVAQMGHRDFKEEGCLASINGQFLRKGSIKGLNLECAKAPEEKLKVY